MEAAPRQVAPESFDPAAYIAKQAKHIDTGSPGSPLERALAHQPGDVVTVETPTGPAKFTRDGSPFYDAGESEQMGKAGGARLRERALEGGLSFLSGSGLVDELAGAKDALAPGVLGSQIADTYRKGRDAARADIARATRNASPMVDVMGMKMAVLPMLGAVLPSLLSPVPGSGWARMASAGIQGSGAAAANSEADLTRGQAAEFAQEVVTGGGTSLAAGALAEGLSAPLRWLAGKATSEASAAKAAGVAAAQALEDKALRSATSSMGGVAAGGANSIEKMEQVLANPSGYATAVVAEARTMRALPEIQKAMDRAAAGNLDKLRRFIPDYEAAELARSEAANAARPSAVLSGVEAKLEPSAALKDLGGKAWRSVGQRAVLGGVGSALGSGVDAVMGTEDQRGAKYGGLAGLLAGPGAVQFMRNAAGSPVVQSNANRLASALMKASTTGISKAALMATPVKAQSDAAQASRLSAAYAAMMQKYGVAGPRP